MTKKELHEGIGGNGSAIWIVVTVSSAGLWIWQEIFSSESEARLWMRFA